MESSNPVDDMLQDARAEDCVQLPEMTSKDNDLLASLEEIEKLDAILRVKITEERKAKLSRIQLEEEFRDVLSKLQFSRVPDKVKGNVKQFMKLLSEASNTETGSPSRFKEGVTGEEPEDRGGGGEGEGKEGCRRDQNNLRFVERNILLAKCGHGTLSLTDEEKSRIENLLVDVEDSEVKLSMAKEPEENQPDETGPQNKEESYAFDDETKSILGEIDQRLEALSKFKISKGLKYENVPVEKNNNPEKSDSDENIKQNRSKGRKKEKKGSRLEEINKLLISMNSTADEDVHPLPPEEIENLVEESKRRLREETKEAEGEKAEGSDVPEDVITELVSAAKSLMPKFRYRFEES